MSGFGLIPHATAEISGSERRLDRIVRLIQSDVRRIYDGEIIFAEKLMPLRV